MPDEQENQPSSDANAPERRNAAEEAAAEALEAAQEAMSSVEANTESAEQPAPSTEDPDDAAPFSMPSFSASENASLDAGIDLLSDVNLRVTIELGRTEMLVEDVLRLGEGSVVELDKLAGDPVDIYVNDRHVARGEVLVLNDNFCVRINEILTTQGLTSEPKERKAG